MDSLEGMPTVFTTLLDRLDSKSERWDRRFDPERFTLREVLAHMVDYDAIWNEYIDLALAKSDGPAEVPLYSPDLVASRRDYSAADPWRSVQDLRVSRATLVAKLRPLETDSWVAHAITSPRHGLLNIDELASLFVGHDGYHARQIAEFVTAA